MALTTPLMDTEAQDWDLVHMILGVDEDATSTDPALDKDLFKVKTEDIFASDPVDLSSIPIEYAEVMDAVVPQSFISSALSSLRPGIKDPNSFSTTFTATLAQSPMVADVFTPRPQLMFPVMPGPMLGYSTPISLSSSAMMTPVGKMTPTSKKEKSCSFQGCTKLARSRGLCMRHGGGRRCGVEGCNKGSQSGGLCISHGGGKRCKIDSCQNAQQSDGLCITHGGGKRCSVEGCEKSSQRRGLCHVHGGGQKCNILGCTKGAQRSGLCVEHGGRRYCKQHGCQKTARGGGFCVTHGGDSRCSVGDCCKISKEDGVCSFHLNKSTPKATTP